MPKICFFKKVESFWAAIGWLGPCNLNTGIHHDAKT